MEHYTYLLINFFTVIVCFIFSFHPKIKFSRHFKAFFASAFLVGAVFILWDIWFTKTGVWWFNDRYILGIRFFELPLEEILFFFCIPFSCLFTYFCIDKFFNLDWKPFSQHLFVIFCIFSALIISFYFDEYVYTFVTFLSVSVSMFVLHFILKERWLGKASVIYLILMPFFLIVNGILTGTGLESPIVNYTPGTFMGIRLLTIPLEDAVFGYELIIWNIYLFQKLKKNEEKN